MLMRRSIVCAKTHISRAHAGKTDRQTHTHTRHTRTKIYLHARAYVRLFVCCVPSGASMHSRSIACGRMRERAKGFVLRLQLVLAQQSSHICWQAIATTTGPTAQKQRICVCGLDDQNLPHSIRGYIQEYICMCILHITYTELASVRASSRYANKTCACAAVDAGGGQSGRCDSRKWCDDVCALSASIATSPLPCACRRPSSSSSFAFCCDNNCFSQNKMRQNVPGRKAHKCPFCRTRYVVMCVHIVVQPSKQKFSVHAPVGNSGVCTFLLSLREYERLIQFVLACVHARAAAGSHERVARRPTCHVFVSAFYFLYNHRRSVRVHNCCTWYDYPISILVNRTSFSYVRHSCVFL